MSAAAVLAPDRCGPWLGHLIGMGQVWIFPADFLPGVERVAGLDVRRAAGIHMPYLAHPVHRLHPIIREDPVRG